MLGFCMGVRRAVETAKEEAKRAKEINRNVFTFGPLIHNPEVLDDLKALGVSVISDNSPLPDNSTVIIRAHGLSPAVEEKLRGSGCRVIDATCPRVKKSQLKARELAREGYCLFLAGEAGHAEITGLLGYAEDAPFREAANSAEKAKSSAETLFRVNKNAKTALLGQTTISEAEYKDIGTEIKKYFPSLKIVNTICAAAAERQNALRELLPSADAVIIAGGRESANTRKLLTIAGESGKPCVIAERASDIPDSFRGYETVGLCAGASTPDSVIDEIEQEMLL